MEEILVLMQKRVLIVSQYFYPESFRINELAFELADKGYNVDVLTAIPNYPEGKYYKGYGVFRNRKECIKGVNVYRCFHIPRGNAGNLLMSLNYLSFLFTASFRVVFQFVWKKKYDAIIGFQMSPITQVVPGCLLGSIRRSKVFTWVQDIWPDSITDNTTEKQNRILLPPLTWITEYVYRHSDKILITSKGMAGLVNRRADYGGKIIYVPNWCDDFSTPSQTPIDFQVPQGFNIMMAGNIGEGIGPDEVINAIRELSDNHNINFLFVGGGSRVDYMKRKAKEYQLNNIFFLGKYPYETMGTVYSATDALLLTLMKTNSPHLDVTVPSRLQAYMSAGKPVFAMIGTGARDVINEAHCGFVTESGDYKGLAQLIKENYRNRELLKEYGNNARIYFLEHFTLQAGVSHFEKLID